MGTEAKFKTLILSSEGEFDKAIAAMEVPDVIQTVSMLQKEMKTEQETFDQLTLDISDITDQSSPEYQEVSNELVKCQNRLALLMKRNMKCFNQQSARKTVGIANSLNAGQTITVPGGANKPKNRNSNSTTFNFNRKSAADNQCNNNTKRTSNGDTVHITQNGDGMQNPLTSSPRTKTKTVTKVVKKTVVTSKDGTQSVRVSDPVITKTTENGTRISLNLDNQKRDSASSESSKNDSPRNYAEPTGSQNSSRRSSRGSDTSKEVIIIGKTERDENNIQASDNKKDVIVLNKTETLKQPVSDNRNNSADKSVSSSSSSSSESSFSSSSSSTSSSLQVSKIDVRKPEAVTVTTKSTVIKSYGENGTDSVDTPVTLIDGKGSNDINQITVTKKVEKKAAAPKVPDYATYINVTKEVVIKSAAPIKISDETIKKDVSKMPDYTTTNNVVIQSAENVPSTIPGTMNATKEVVTEVATASTDTSHSVPVTVIDQPQTPQKNITILETDAKIQKEPVHNGQGASVVESESDEKVEPKVKFINWDPTKLLKELYKVKLEEEAPEEEVSHRYINMEGYMEKLPMGKKKATLLKTWKRRYFKAKDGNLFYYDPVQGEPHIWKVVLDIEESNRSEKASGLIKLMGGNVEDLGSCSLGIDDGRGHYLMVRCPTQKEYEDWKLSLATQTFDNARATYVHPVLKAPRHKTKRVVIIDLGSSSIRAGILGSQPSLPDLFFPTVVAIDNKTGSTIYGFDAFKPDVRERSKLEFPVMPSQTVDKGFTGMFNVDMEVMPGLLQKIFMDLKVDPSEYWVMLSTPQNFSHKIKEQFMKILVGKFYVMGVNMVNQPFLSVYSYNSTSGVMVDIGERLEVVPITDGYIVEAGVSRQAVGGRRITDTLTSTLTEYRLFTEIEKLIIRYVMERSCYMALDYKKETSRYFQDASGCNAIVDLSQFDLPAGAPQSITVNTGRFKSPEGLIQKEEWGMDDPSISKLVFKAAQACPMDTRREMYRSIYLSGGVTLIPGFAERLEVEIKKVVPSSVGIQIHSHPHRNHAAYIGACSLANMKIFEDSCITKAEWKTHGVQILKKWQRYFQG